MIHVYFPSLHNFVMFKDICKWDLLPLRNVMCIITFNIVGVSSSGRRGCNLQDHAAKEWRNHSHPLRHSRRPFSVSLMREKLHIILICLFLWKLKVNPWKQISRRIYWNKRTLKFMNEKKVHAMSFICLHSICDISTYDNHICMKIMIV